MATAHLAPASCLPEKAIPIKISYAEYKQHLTTDNMIRATAICHIEEGSTALVEHDITLSNPSVTIKVTGPCLSIGWGGGHSCRHNMLSLGKEREQ